jgi:probable rRNA maturation factor
VKINITNLQKAVKIDLNQVKKIARKALLALGEEKSDLSVCIVDNSQIKDLNYKYKGLNRPTDVLAFSLREGQGVRGGEFILGDVVISAQIARSQAKRLRRKIKDEINLYIVHGILHLVGYDDNTKAARKKMEAMQEKLASETAKPC